MSTLSAPGRYPLHNVGEPNDHVIATDVKILIAPGAGTFYTGERL